MNTNNIIENFNNSSFSFNKANNVGGIYIVINNTISLFANNICNNN